MAGPSPGPLVSSSQAGSVHNVVFYLQQHGNGNQFGGEAGHSQNVNAYMQASHNRYRPDGNVKCFPADNYSFERDGGNSYWSYQQQQAAQHQMPQQQQQQQQQQQWPQWNQSDYTDKSCWTQQQQVHQRQVVNNSCMTFNSYPQQQVQQQHQQSYYRSNVVATVTVQSAVSSQSRTPSRCDSVRSETCDSHCSSGVDGDMGSQQQYNMYQNYHQQQQHQMSHQFYQQPAHHQDQQMMQQQLHQQQLQQQQQQQQHHQQQQQQQQCYWSSTSHYDMQQLDHHGQQQDQQMDYFNQSQHNQYYRQYVQQHQQQQQHQAPLQQPNPMQQTYYQQQHHQQQQQQQQQQQMSSCYWQREQQTSAANNQRPFSTLVPMIQNDPSMVVQTPACSSSPVGAADTTTTSPAPYQNHHHQYQAPTPTPSPAEVQAGFVPVDDSLEQSIDEGLSSVIGDDAEEDEEDEHEIEEDHRDRREEATSGPPLLASVPAGWTRDVSAGSVTYISPSGYRVRSLTEAADYVQKDGTCKCGLPCPLRLELVFNFDASVSNGDEERPFTSTCCSHSTPDGAKEKSDEATPDDAPVTCSADQVQRERGDDVGAEIALIEADAVEEAPENILKRKIESCIEAAAAAPPPPTKMAKVQPNIRPPPSPKQDVVVEPKVEQCEASTIRNDCDHEELLGDLLDCIPDSMEEVLDRQKEAVEKAAGKAAKKVAIARNQEPQPLKAIKPQPQPQQASSAALPKLPVPPMPKQQKIASVAPVLAPLMVKTKPPPLAIRPGTPATAARSRAKVAAELSAKNTKTRSPRRANQTIAIQGGMKMLQAVAQPQHQQQQHHHLIQHQQPQHQQQANFWPANIAPLRTTSFPFAYQTQAGAGTPVFSTAATLRPAMGPMTFLTQAPQPGGAPQGPSVFTNPPLPVITTRPALAPSGQVVHVLTTPSGPMLATAPEPTMPILTVGPVNAAPPGTQASNSSRGFTRTGKKRKSTPQTVASILQQATMAPQPAPSPHPATLTLTQQAEPLVYNVQNFQQIQAQPTIQTLALMPDGKTYVVVNSQPAPAQAAAQPGTTTATAGHWLLSPRPGPGQQTLIAPAPQPVNVFCTTPSTFVLNGTSTPHVLQLQDGTIVQTTTDQPNVLTNYGGLFIRCPPTTTNAGAQIFSAPQAVRAVPIPIAPGRSPGRSPDSSSADGVTSTLVPEKVACGEATPPQTLALVKAAHPSPVVQSSQIDSCVHEDASEKSAGEKKPNEFNNNAHWLKPSETNPALSAR